METYIGESTKLHEIFPVTEILRFTFENELYSSYWINLGLEWYKYLSKEQKALFKEDLEKIIMNKRIHQKTRHTARILLRELMS